MQEQARRDEVRPQASLDPKQKPTRNAQGPRADEVVFVEPAELGITGEVRDHLDVCAFVFTSEPPTDVRVPKATLLGAVQIALGVGMFVVQTMRSSPPERAFLRRGCPEKREEQLKRAARLVRAV